MACIEYIDNISSTIPAYYLLSLINPVDTQWPVWNEKTTEWDYISLVYSGVFSLIYFLLGVMCLALVIKRNCARLKTKTFFAIYICLAVLGFSRGLHVALDPFGVQGWLMGRFTQWAIISRSLAALGFPSLTASYTLVFLTLYKSTNLGNSRLWHQDWRVIIPLVSVHYIIAIVAEIIANTASYPALVTVIICEACFSTWGVVICFIYLFAGRRLLNKLKQQCADSNRLSISFSKEKERRLRKTRQPSQSALSDENYARSYSKISQTIRKIAIITYFTALLAIVYAVFSKASLFVTCWLIFYNCLGFNGQGDPIVWLTVQICIKCIEIPLAVIMLYSVTDLNALVGTLRLVFCCCCCKQSKPSKTCSTQSSPTPTQSKSQVSLRTQVDNSSPISTRTNTPVHIDVAAADGIPPSFTISVPPAVLMVHSSTNDSLDTSLA